MTEIASLGLSIRSDGVVVATDRLKDFEGAGRKAEGVAGSLVRTATAMGVALAGAFSINVLGNYADAWSDMQSRIGASIKSMEAAPAFMQRITDIANASYSPLLQTTEIFGRNVTVLNAMGRSAVEAADFTEALNHALVTTATKGQDADVVLNALSRSIAIGGMRAMEFETIMSRSPRVLEAIAEELDTNVTGLRALAQEGKVTGTVIVDALINSLEQLREEAGAMPATLRDAGMIWTNVFTEVVGRVDQAWQATGRLVASSIELAIAFRGTADNLIRIGNIVGAVVGPAFDMLGANMGTITSVATVAVAAMAGFYAPAMISGLWATSAALVTGIAGGINTITAAMLRNPLGLLISGLAAAVTAAYLFRDQIKQAIGVDVVEVAKAGGNMLIQAFDLAFRNIGTIWGALPSVLGDITISTANAVISGIQSMINGAIGLINDFTRGARDALGAIGLQVGDIGEVSIGTFDNPYANSLGGLGEKLGQNLKDTSGIDYLGGLASMLGDVWTNADGASGAIGALAGQLDGDAGSGGAAGGLAGAASAANDNMKKLAEDGIAKVGQFGQQVLSTLSSGFADLFKGLISGTKSAGEAISDLLGKLGDLFINQAFNMLFGVGMGGGGGGGIFGWLGGLFGFANGGYTGNMGRSSVAGVVHGGEYVFSAPAVDRIGLGNLDSMHRSARGYQSGGYVTPTAYTPANSNNYLTIRTISEVRNGNLVPVMTEVAGEVAGQTVAQSSPAIVGAAVNQSNKSAPSAVARYQAQRGGADYRTM